jgi:hypothetical protein
MPDLQPRGGYMCEARRTVWARQIALYPGLQVTRARIRVPFDGEIIFLKHEKIQRH